MSELVPYLEPLIEPDGPEGWAEEVAGAIWDRPAIETREEFLGALHLVFERLVHAERRRCAKIAATDPGTDRYTYALMGAFAVPTLRKDIACSILRLETQAIHLEE